MEKTLIAYFSAQGTTARIAKAAAKLLEADVFEIKPEVPYTFGLYLSWAQETCAEPSLVREDRDGLASGLPAVPPGAPPGIYAGTG